MIEHLKSGLSISTHVGCGLKCSYCILSVLSEFNNGPILNIEPENLINELLNNSKLYLRDVTPIMINNRTDPFLPVVTPYTLKILDLLIDEKIKSPIIIISKFAPPEELKKYFNHLNIIYFYSYSGIKTDFNYSKVYDDVIKIEKIVPHDSAYHYFRPIIPGLNDDEKTINDIINIFKTHNFFGSIIAGLRTTDSNKNLIKDPNIDISNIDYSHKLVDSDIYNVNRKYIKNNSNYYIFRHTSCAIANKFHRRNSLNYFNRSAHCFTNCPNYSECSNNDIKLESILDLLIKKFDDEYEFSIKDDAIVILNECDQELVAYIKNAYGCNVIAEKLKHSKLEEVIFNEKK